MINNFKYFLFIIFFSLHSIENVKGDEPFVFNITEIEILKNGNQINGYKGGTAISKDGSKIIAENFLLNNKLIAAGILSELLLKFNNKDIANFRISAKKLFKENEFSKATTIIEKGLEVHKENIDLLVDKALSLSALQEHKKASECLEKVLNSNKNHYVALVNLGLSKRREGKLSEAKNIFKKAKEIDPKNEKINISLATCYSESGEINFAEKLYSEIIKNNKNASEAKSSLGMLYLRNTMLDKGWPLLKSRLNLQSANISYKNFPFKVWDGEDIKNENILVWTEQGIGEEVLISTMLNDLTEKAKSITLLCSERMVPLFKRSFSRIKISERREPLSTQALDPSIKYQMSLNDIGLLTRPNLESFDFKKKSSLKANHVLTKKLREKYKALTKRDFLIGLSWKSETPNIGTIKSIDPFKLSSLNLENNLGFISLQYNPSQKDIKKIKQFAGKSFTFDTLIDPLTNLDMAASQIAAMDYVVTISNTTAHLAGALDIPTALLLPPETGRHWYWFNNLKKSPWYDSITIFECSKNLDWSDAIGHVTKNIIEILKI